MRCESSEAQVVTGTAQLLIADGLSNTFDGSRFQFEDISLTVCKGQKLGLVGINGCGKSTLLKVRVPPFCFECCQQQSVSFCRAIRRDGARIGERQAQPPYK